MNALLTQIDRKDDFPIVRLALQLPGRFGVLNEGMYNQVRGTTKWSMYIDKIMIKTWSESAFM